MRSAIVAVWLALAALTAATAADERTPPPLDEREVVRRFVEGTSISTLLNEIASREPRFDVSPEMIQELRLAGLPAALIEAMQRRQAAAAPAPDPGAKAPPAAVPLGLQIRLDPDSLRTFDLPAEVEPRLATAWGLNGPQERRVEQLAVYAACLTPTHVPDQWRGRSALGRDFHSMPRHELLFFQALETHAGRGRGLHVELPQSVEIPLDASAPHDLSFGLALGAGGRYFRLISLEQAGIDVSAGPLTYSATIRRGDGPLGLEVNWVSEPAPTP